MLPSFDYYFCCCKQGIAPLLVGWTHWPIPVNEGRHLITEVMHYSHHLVLAHYSPAKHKQKLIHSHLPISSSIQDRPDPEHTPNRTVEPPLCRPPRRRIAGASQASQSRICNQGSQIRNLNLPFPVRLKNEGGYSLVMREVLFCFN